MWQVLETDDTAALAISDLCGHAHKQGRYAYNPCGVRFIMHEDKAVSRMMRGRVQPEAP